MGKKLIIGIIIIAIVALGILLFVIRNVGDVYKEENLPAQQCTISGSYCFYDDVPSYMENYSVLTEFDENDGVTFVLFGDAIVDSIKQLEEYEEYFTINYISGKANYNCASTNKDAGVIEYFYQICGEGVVGCGHERRAIICGDVYFVEDFTSTYGPRFYGPFEI